MQMKYKWATLKSKGIRYSRIRKYNLPPYQIIYSNDFPLRPMPETEEHPYLLLAEWAPRGHGLIMVQDYDVYYRKSPTSHTGYRITNTAVPGVVSNGVPDWLYEGIDNSWCSLNIIWLGL